MRLGFLVLGFLLLSGCSTAPIGDLDQVRPGMDKDYVLTKVGNPKRTFRSNGQDHWIYVYFKDEVELTRQIDFSDGKVLKIGRPISKQSLERSLESSETMEEFEAKAREHQRKSTKFKDIDGEKP